MKSIFTMGLAAFCLFATGPVFANTNIIPAPAITDTVNCDLVVSLDVAGDCYVGGALMSTITGGTAPFAYLWNNGITTPDAVGLGTGSYHLIVIDANGCADTASAQIDLSDGMVIGEVINHPMCGSNNGSIVTSLSGGFGPFTYAWNTGHTGTSLGSLSYGVYELTVTDVNGCSVTEAFSLTNIVGMITTASITHDTCATSNGAISVVTIGGNMPYSYEWANGSTSTQISNLSAGYYYVTVTDSLGCVTTTIFTVEQVEAPVVTANVVDASCVDGGSVFLVAAGGTEPYSYAWNTGNTESSMTGLAAGTYEVTVTDANGCSVLQTAVIAGNGGNPPSVSYTLDNPGCGEGNGAITVNVTGGEAPYTFAWSSGETTQNISDLSAGTYVVTVTGNDGCAAVATITVTGTGSCDAPATASATVSGYSATITWDAVPCVEKYRVRVKRLGAQGGPWMMFVVPANQTSYTLNNLVPGATYKYRIRSQCSPNGSIISPMTPSQYFTAPGGVATCAVPAGILHSDETASGATLSWTATEGAYGYRIRYRAAGTSSWTPVVINNGTTSSYVFSSLSGSTAYEYQIATKCDIGPNVFSDFSSVAIFTTLGQRIGESIASIGVISVYPNPTAGDATLQLPYAVETGEVFVVNAVGQTVMHQVISTHTASLRLATSELAPGLYMVEVRNAGQRLTGRLVKE